MRHLARWLLNALTVIAFALALLAMMGWMSSRTHPQSWSTWASAGPIQAANRGDIVSLQWHRDPIGRQWPVDPPGRPVHAIGVTFATGTGVYAPWWEVCAVAVLLAVAVAWWRVPRRAPSGSCPNCRYDLTGNVSGVCPECGTKVVTEDGD